MSLNVWRNLNTMHWRKHSRRVPFCNSVMNRNTIEALRVPIFTCTTLRNHLFFPAALLYIHQISGMVVGLRQSWRFSGRGSSEMPLGSSTRTRGLFLMATLLAGDLAAAVGDVVIFKLRHPSWSNLHLEGQMFDMSNVTLHVSLVLDKQYISC